MTRGASATQKDGQRRPSPISPPVAREAAANGTVKTRTGAAAANAPRATAFRNGVISTHYNQRLSSFNVRHQGPRNVCFGGKRTLVRKDRHKLRFPQCQRQAAEQSEGRQREWPPINIPSPVHLGEAAEA